MSVETASSIGSVASAATVAAAEMSSSFSAPSFSGLETSPTIGIPASGEIFGKGPSLSDFTDGGVISKGDPFSIEASVNPFLTETPLDGFSDGLVQSQATEIAQKAFEITSEPLSTSEVIFEAENILKAASREVSLENLSDLPDVEAEPVLKVELLEEFVDENREEVGITVSQISQLETQTDIEQAQKTINAFVSAGLPKEFALEKVGPVLEEKGLVCEEVEEEQDGEILKKLVVKQKIDLEVVDPKFIIDQEALSHRDKIADEAVDAVFDQAKEDGEVSGEDIAEAIPQALPHSEVMSQINKEDDPTPNEYVKRDIRALGELESSEDAKKKIKDIQRKHVPVAFGNAGKGVTEDDVKKVFKEKKIA